MDLLPPSKALSVRETVVCISHSLQQHNCAWYLEKESVCERKGMESPIIISLLTLIKATVISPAARLTPCQLG